MNEPASARPSSTPALATLGGERCPVCRAVARPAIDVGNFRLFACAQCGCWSSDALARHAETSFVAEGYFRNAGADRPRWEALLRRLPGKAPVTSVLDVGCGAGAFLAFMGGRCPGIRQAGIEIDAGRAAQARAANPAATIVTGDAAAALDALAPPGPGFDLITLWDVLEHVADPGQLVRSLAPKLAPRGVIFIQTIHENSVVPALGRLSYRLSGGRLRSLARRTHDAHHLVFFSRAGIARLAEDSGLHVARSWFDRLALARMDGPALLTVPTALLLALENAWGNGLFVNVILAAGFARGPRAGRRGP